MEESTTDEAVGMHGGYEQISATSTGENGERAEITACFAMS